MLFDDTYLNDYINQYKEEAKAAFKRCFNLDVSAEDMTLIEFQFQLEFVLGKVLLDNNRE